MENLLDIDKKVIIQNLVPVEDLTEIMQKHPTFFSISQLVGSWVLHTTHSNLEIPLLIYKNWDGKKITYSTTLVWSDSRIKETKGIGGMSFGMSEDTIQEVLERAMRAIDDFYNPDKMI